jgi:hypothetical protein
MLPSVDRLANAAVDGCTLVLAKAGRKGAATNGKIGETEGKKGGMRCNRGGRFGGTGWALGPPYFGPGLGNVIPADAGIHTDAPKPVG